MEFGSFGVGHLTFMLDIDRGQQSQAQFNILCLGYPINTGQLLAPQSEDSPLQGLPNLFCRFTCELVKNTDSWTLEYNPPRLYSLASAFPQSFQDTI